YTAKMDPDISYIKYNDEPPTGANESITANAKGVIATDDTLGFWLMHNVPKFAAQESDHKYVSPMPGETNGQTDLCITLEIIEMDKVFTQMLYIQPDIYAMNISTGLKSKSKTIGALTARKWSSGDKHVETVVSAGGVQFTSISKTPDYHLELYTQFVAPVLNVSLLAESWGQRVDTQLPTLGTHDYNMENVQNTTANTSKKGTGMPETIFLCVWFVVYVLCFCCCRPNPPFSLEFTNDTLMSSIFSTVFLSLHSEGKGCPAPCLHVSTYRLVLSTGAMIWEYRST
ncbi:unnamed protein product, partial [Oppiella nova]